MHLANGLNLLSIKDSTFDNGFYGLEIETSVNEMKLDNVEFCNFFEQDISGLGSVDTVDVKDVSCDDAYDDSNAQLDVTDQICEDSCKIDQFVYCRAL